MAKVNIPAEQARAVVVVLHGWEGSADATYMLSLGHALLERGCITVRINFRDHGGTQSLNEGLFHSCRIDEVVSAVAAVRRQYPSLPLYLAGFSLGGNFALRVAAHARSPRTAAGCLLYARSCIRRTRCGRWRMVCGCTDSTISCAAGAGLCATKAAAFSRKFISFGDLRSTAYADCDDGLSLCWNYTAFGSLEEYLNGYSIIDGQARQH